jgi:haloacetate dehalogenase
VLLLHGFPQDHTCWQRVVPALAREHAVVICDLKGCGASTAPRGEGYSAREIAAELVEVMGRVGFAVVGHDRGARVGYRMALDHPDRITHPKNPQANSPPQSAPSSLRRCHTACSAIPERLA